MALDNVVGKKIPRNFDRDAVAGVKNDTGIYVGVVKDNLSPARDGRLRVWIPDFGGHEEDEQNWRKVNYASPYFGSTYRSNKSTNNTFNDVPHSYGMWAVPPDLGNLVLCTFINGQPDRGYWFACINENLSQYMVPVIAAGNVIDKNNIDPSIKASVLPGNSATPQYLPVAEFNENASADINGTFYDNPKPIHAFQANILFMQGLDRDKTRGAISSNSQRETPSYVFGISTPGRPLGKDPADDPNYLDKVNNGSIPTDQYAVPVRKGGHTFVMDDGDVNGVDQLMRLRTAGGHQLLMSDDQSTIYISHKNGTTWLEIGDSGVNVYTKGDFSVRSEGDINFHSDGDINMQAVGSVNIDSAVSHTMTSPQIKIGGAESTVIYGAKMSMGGGEIIVSSDGKLSMSSAAAMKINGSTIDINGGGGGISIPNPTIKKEKHADTTYDGEATKLWSGVPAATDSIVKVLPSHEPWTRTQPAVPLTKEVSNNVCAPKTGSAPVYTLPPPNSNNLDRGKVKYQPVPWTTDTAFLDKVKSVATALNANYIDMLAFMYNESGGTFDPAIQGPQLKQGRPVGLIQFLPSTAIGLGTTVDALAQLSRVDQMDWVLKYYNYFKFTTKAPTPKLQDLYLCTFWPAAIGKPDNYVIAQPNSDVAQANKGLQAADGSITCASVGAAAAKNLPLVQQALANAGTAPAQSGTLSSGNGSTITDGFGNPVRSGTTSTTGSSTDLGISAAAGLAVVGNTCPAEYLAKTSTYSPSSGIGNTSPKFTQAQVKALMAELGYFESQFNYSMINSDGTRIGKYQVDAAYLAAAGYIKPDAIKQYGTSTLSKGESWTGKDSIQSQNNFFASATVQDTIQFNEFTNNYASLVANGGIMSADDICAAAGMLFVAHQFRSVDSALKWRKQGTLTDAYGHNGTDYFNQGRYAIDVLAAGGGATSPSVPSSASGPTVPSTSGGANTSGINPDDVLTFSNSGTGTRSNFDQLNGTFKNAILQMARDFKLVKGSKITITSAYRSPADQDAIYQRWLAAGGGPNMPTAGGITTPAKPISLGGKGSPHNSGVAIDSGQATLVNATVNLAQYGLRWGGTFSKPDQVHIQMANAS